MPHAMKDGITRRAPHSSGRSRLPTTLLLMNLEQHINIRVTSLGFDLLLEIFLCFVKKVSSWLLTHRPTIEYYSER